MQGESNSRVIFGQLFLLGVMAVGMIIGSVFWLTARIDRLEQESSEDLVELMVTERVASLANVTADIAHWDLAYELVTARDVETLSYDVGTSASPDGLFSHLLILAHDGSPLFLFGEMGLIDEFDLSKVQPFLTGLRGTRPADKVTITGVGALEDGYGAIAATYIVPEYVDELDPETLPILIGIKMFTKESLQAIVALTQGSGYAINKGTNPEAGPVVPLIGPDGQPIAELVWSPNKLGTILRDEILPGIVLICCSIFGICLSAAAYFNRQSNALEQAVSVATTDRLTGLMNRAGLDEILNRPHVKDQMTKGLLAILYIDLNDFKKLNDFHGHKIGDLALVVLARRLEQSVRSEDFVVRLGGDEFICIILDSHPEQAAKSVSDRLILTCGDPIRASDTEIALSPAIGIAVARPGMTWDALLDQADTAMFEAKRNKGQYAVVLRGVEDPIAQAL